MFCLQDKPGHIILKVANKHAAVIHTGPAHGPLKVPRGGKREED